VAAISNNDQAGAEDLAALSIRLRGVAEAMKNLSGDRPDFRERLEELRNELNSVCSRLRRVS